MQSVMTAVSQADVTEVNTTIPARCVQTHNFKKFLAFILIINIYPMHLTSLTSIKEYLRSTLQFKQFGNLNNSPRK